MSSFLPVDIDKFNVKASNLINQIPPQLSESVGVNIDPGQAGNSPIVQALLKIPGADNFVAHGSAFPYKKPVSFMLLDRNGAPAKVPEGNQEGFSDGYFFKMHINPSNMQIALPPKTVSAVRTLGGWKLQHWYPDIGSISADGLIGNMMENYNRDLKDSKAWRGFRKLISVYNNNGVSYVAPGGNLPRKSLQKNQFSPTAVCFFDKYKYEGYFENLSYTESEETPNTIKYNFSFKFTSMSDLGDIPGLTRESSIDAAIVSLSKKHIKSASSYLKKNIKL